MRKNVVSVLAAVIGLATPFLGVTAAHSEETATDPQMQRLLDLNPGATLAEMETGLADTMATSGLPRQAVLGQAIAEAEDSLAKASVGATHAPAGDTFSTASSDGSGSDYNYRLGNSRRKGDIFYYPASTYFVPHGHVGLYDTIEYIVEAPGGDLNTRRVVALNRKVPYGTKKMFVNVTLAKRQDATRWARNHLGRPYTNNFAFNRTVESSNYNCSQYVWAAFKKFGTDLDSNGGAGVYPTNIRDHAKTEIYQRIPYDS